MARDLVIGVDSSTTATKAVAWDRHGRALGEGRGAVPLGNPHPGHFEQDAADWWSSTVTALRGLGSKVDLNRAAALAISNQRETFGLFDREGQAIRPATVWLDERAKPQTESFGQAFGAERLHALTGKPVDVTPCLYRYVWFKEREPGNWREAEMVAEVHAYLTYRLTGKWRTSRASADPTGILDMRAGGYAAELLDAVGLPEHKLPVLFTPGEVMGEVTDEAAAATGLPVGLAVVAGGGDGQCAGTGTGTLGPGHAYLNLGTAAVSGSYGKAYAHDPAFRTMRAVAEEGYIYESCLRTGTFLVDWLVREMFSVDPRENPAVFAELEAEAAAVPIGSGGIALVPYWSGCMTPYWDTGARGVIAGLSSSHKRGHVYRALMEGVALEQAVTTERIARATNSPIDVYYAIGGGAASDLWCAILADATGREVRRLNTVEASALGAGVAAAKGAGWFDTVAEAAASMRGEVLRVFQPEPDRHARYSELASIYRDLWPSLASWNRRLQQFAENDR